MGDKKAEKEFIVRFIEVYRGLPALWDVKCKDYTNRAKKGEQYDVLIEKLRKSFGSITLSSLSNSSWVNFSLSINHCLAHFLPFCDSFFFPFFRLAATAIIAQHNSESVNMLTL